MHGVKPAALCWAADQADVVVLGWALRSSDEDGLRGLEIACRARKEAGEGKGALARWQRAHGLTADGIVGERTLAALGLT